MEEDDDSILIPPMREVIAHTNYDSFRTNVDLSQASALTPLSTSPAWCSSIYRTVQLWLPKYEPGFIHRPGICIRTCVPGKASDTAPELPIAYTSGPSYIKCPMCTAILGPLEGRNHPAWCAFQDIEPDASARGIDVRGWLEAKTLLTCWQCNAPIVSVNRCFVAAYGEAGGLIIAGVPDANVLIIARDGFAWPTCRIDKCFYRGGSVNELTDFPWICLSCFKSLTDNQVGVPTMDGMACRDCGLVYCPLPVGTWGGQVMSVLPRIPTPDFGSKQVNAEPDEDCTDASTEDAAPHHNIEDNDDI